MEEARRRADARLLPPASQLDAELLSEQLRHRAAVVSGFAALIADEAVETSELVVDEHLTRLLANVDEMRALVGSWHRRAAEDRPLLVRDTVAAHLVPQPRTGDDLTTTRTLLVVEHDDDHFEMVRSLLRRASNDLDWHVVQARTLAEAVDLLASGEPTCSLVNLALPDVSPGEVVRVLRDLAPEHPIVVVTGYPENGAGVDAVRQGAQDYLIKGSMSADVLDRSLRYAIERSRVKSVLAHQALHDALTGLPNRTLLTERLNLAVARLSRGTATAGVLFVDLDRFKLVNDTMGHRVGDQLLQAVADRLRSKVRRADMVARFGGDEFVVLVEDLQSPNELTALADQLLAIFAQPFAGGTGEHWLTASVGVAVLDTAVPADVVLANADAAMYRAKESGRSQWALFDDGMHASLLERMEIEQQLAQALEADQLVLHYQPICLGRTGAVSSTVVGTEALLRWEHPTKGHLLPGVFLPVAEDSGQIVSIGAWVIGQACLQTRAWLDQGVVDETWTTWVNVSTRQLDRPGLEDAVVAALTASQLPAACLGLEITESAFIKDEERAQALAVRLSALGVRLAVDDFGTGYSSMRRLRDLPLHHLKVDGSFVAGIVEHRADRAIVTACVELAHAMGMVPVAEGVETGEQLAVLAEIGCHLTQGFWHARPQDALGMTEQLRTQRSAQEDFAR